MPYIVTNSDGSLTATVADNTVDTATYSLALVGRNVSNYGQFFAQNTIRHLENFASTVAPSPSVRLVGQLWYDKREQLLRVWDGAAWRRATNIGVGPRGNRPPESDPSLSGGEGFYNLTTNKLQIWNGSAWRDASYPGNITSEFANDQLQNRSTFLGSRIRSLLLKDSQNGLLHPVLAICYVNSPAEGISTPFPPKGQTETSSGQFETIVALFSETQFDISSDDSFFTELTAPGGIAAVRPSGVRPQARILRGINLRADSEEASVGVSDVLVANSAIISGELQAGSLGSPSNIIPNATINNLSVRNSFDIDGNLLLLSGNIEAANSALNIGNVFSSGDVISNSNVICQNLVANTSVSSPTGVFDNLTVTNNTTLNGSTTINGNITVNGVNTQTIGSETEVIEDYFGENITTANITVTNSLASLSTSLFTGDIQANTATFAGNVVFGSAIGLSDQDIITTGNISAGSLTITGGGNISGASTGSFTANVSAPLFTGNISGTTGSFTGSVSGNTGTFVTGNITTINATTGNFSGNVTAQFFNGTATSAQYADLAEIYAADADYEPGTVVCIGGAAEITATTQYADTEVFGVISTDPAYLMNSGAQGLPVALQGRVPVKVIGKVYKGQRLVSAMVAGTACALIDETQYDPRTVIGRALADKDTEDAGVIEAVIGVK